MGEENIDITIPSEDIEPETGDMMNDSRLPIQEHSDNDKEQADMDCDVEANESAAWLADNSTDVVTEEGEDSRQNHQTVDDVNGQPSSAEATGLSGPLRRIPTAVIVGADHKFPVRSRYRRASIGSCHDSCKYGHKHEPEKVNRRPLLGTIRENKPLMRTTSGDHLANFVPQKETKNKALLRRRSLPGPVLGKVPPSNTDGASSSKNVTRSPTQSKVKRGQSEVKSPPARTPGSSFGKSKVDIPAVKKTPQEKSVQKVKEIKTKVVGSSSESKKASSSGSKAVKAKEPIINSSRTPLKRSASVKARLYKDLKSSSSSRRQSNSENGKVASDVLEKAAHMVEPNASNSPAGKALKSPLSNEESPSTQSKSRTGKAKKSDVTRKGARLSLSSISSSITSKSAASSSRRTGQPQGEYRPKTDSSNTRPTGPITEAGGSRTRTPRSKAAANVKTKAKKTESRSPEEKDGSAWKVKFRRGTVVNLQVANTAPRKLRFKRGRILGDQNAKTDADKNLKNTDDVTDETPDTKPEREKVQLRRQEASGKKDSVDLNDVIEETASKLVKTRKSKVKALVGAFETVMSFRDRKPLVETGAS
ncbi:hypothetical protein RND81_10G215800 [Saponaria officinalis]|uniref:Calmodulin-binding domain-containing protein n=1 Tax=Saponaria officinalis TaxID=3572 RepID=A0AAW1I4U2_SAPOF